MQEILGSSRRGVSPVNLKLLSHIEREEDCWWFKKVPGVWLIYLFFLYVQCLRFLLSDFRFVFLFFSQFGCMIV